MLNRLRVIFRAWRGLRAFKSVPRKERKIVFYSEGSGYWTYFQPVFQALWENHAQAVLYLTSEERDPIYQNPPNGLRAFYIGKGWVRTLFFATLDVDILVMTMPDLQTFHIKRSPHPVHYAYLNHSMVSTHMVYRPGAFDYFDSVLCVGPHHIREIRHREAALSLKPKVLVNHGYGRLDTILSQNKNSISKLTQQGPGRVLIAPTWGPNSTLNLYGTKVVWPLIRCGLQVILRPHPQTRRKNPALLDGIAAELSGEELFSMDENGDAHDTLAGSEIMISDWSGAALEFALGLERPVIFIDTPRKVLNPDYESVGMEPLEVALRSLIGVIVSTNELSRLGDIALEIIRDAISWQEKISAARSQWIFNVGASGNVGAKFLMDTLPS